MNFKKNAAPNTLIALKGFGDSSSFLHRNGNMTSTTRILSV
jgi:hypothetical protein